MRPEELERWTRDFKAQGYRASVAARRLMTEHSLEQAAAVQLVERIYGAKADPYALETTSGVIHGLAGVAAGLALVALPFVLDLDFHHGLSSDRWDIWDLKSASSFVLGGLAIAGGGVVRVIFALVNRGTGQPTP